MKSKSYPFVHHPCFTDSRENLWARIHLPVARVCNIKCIFCDHSAGSSCHSSKPGYAQRLMTPEEAIKRAIEEIELDNRLRIVAISGPGEPLVNNSTFVTLKGLQNHLDRIHFCLSTNGVLLQEKVPLLKSLGVESLSVTVNAINPNTAALVYEWARLDGNVLQGEVMGEHIIKRQLSGIKLATDMGIIVKVNTVLIPEINNQDIKALSKKLAENRVSLQNIVPLIPCGNTQENMRPPTEVELQSARALASRELPQFRHCKQCRSDVVGIPGNDRIL